MKAKKDGIASGFWVEDFGEVEIVFYPDDDVITLDLRPEKCYQLNNKVVEAFERICNTIQQESNFKK